jgi:N-acetylmuramoyl-L-alanine amidase CwlA
MSSVEFITVHYTGNMSKGADAAANAAYFVEINSVSIHYTTGNDGIYHCMDDNKGAYHAGDGASKDQVGAFDWLSTGVKAPAGVTAHDLLNIKVTVSDDCYYEINGQKTKIKLPSAYIYKDRASNHTYNDKGQVVNAETGSVRDAETYFNKMGFRFIVEGGEYKMAKTWWCYTQVYEGRICSVGGNRNSIGIESCVNEGSNLWYTWQITAQLVAHLMQENDLDINRVVGHHFYTAKDCPQPMLDNDMEIWYEFRDLIEAEYEKLTEFEDYKFELSTNSSTHLHSSGYAKYNRKKEITNVCVDYTVTVTNPDGTTEEITLYSMVPLVNLAK